ncbi:MAG: hypothetical protein DRP79_00640 [Planctomycetota bacterium]|nr:MAG: hypothetical protein DRP79_00640 [Planctomycetota bacterium]
MYQDLKIEKSAATAAAAVMFGTASERRIKFRCSCGKHLIQSFSRIGRKGYCPKCRRGVMVPRLDDPGVLAVRCECGFDVPINLIRGGVSTCPKCGRSLLLPKARSAVPPDLLLAAVVYGGLSLIAITTIILLATLL